MRCDPILPLPSLWAAYLLFLLFSILLHYQHDASFCLMSGLLLVLPSACLPYITSHLISSINLIPAVPDIPLLGTGKKAKIEKSSVKQSKKVNFEDTEKEGSQIIEGGRVTPSLVKVCSAGATFLSLMFRLLPLLSPSLYHYYFLNMLHYFLPPSLFVIHFLISQLFYNCRVPFLRLFSGPQSVTR